MTFRIIQARSRVLIVEDPSPLIDERLKEAGLDVLRLETVPDEDGLIEAINTFGAQAVFKRSRVEITAALSKVVRVSLLYSFAVLEMIQWIRACAGATSWFSMIPSLMGIL